MPASSRVTPRIGYVVGRLDRALRREIAALVAPFGLTVPKYTALSILRDRPGLSNAQLARRTYVTPQSMNEVLLSLEADGLIVRTRAANHGRVVEVALSERGHEVLAACDRAITHMENAMLADLDEAGREQLLQALVNCVYRLGAGFGPR
ncbi:MAG TPA: MarR family transcriptional regulator [Solirubrobacter sp.]|jgi:DNA-binding MarR family transcriptional regulator|nr:MarR family transcriptional regulator [Solirubrobacter sp.]